jgi:hypothetical protein
MFDYLVTHILFLVVAVFAITAVNAALGGILARVVEQQPFVAEESWTPPGALAFSKSRRAQALLPFMGATFSSLAAMLFDQAMFVEFFLGGFFLLQLLGASFLLTAILRYWSLRNRASARGQITYSAWFISRSFAAQMVGGSTLALIGFALTLSPALAGAAFWGFSTAAGAYRRASQARRTAKAS